MYKESNLSENWDRLWRQRDIETITPYDGCYQLLRSLLKTNGYSNIIEVGCGSGIRTISLAKELLVSPTLLDFSPVALVLAEENAKRNKIEVKLVNANALDVPFTDNSFDIVWNAGVNEHFNGEDRQKVFNEMARICRPNGQVIVIVPNALNIAYRLWKRVLMIQDRWSYGFESPYSFFELRDRLREAGLTPIKSGGTGTLSSPALLTALCSASAESQVIESPSNKEYFNALRKIVMKTDAMLGGIGVFTGINIGMAGVKLV